MEFKELKKINIKKEYLPTSDPFKNKESLEKTMSQEIKLEQITAANRTLLLVYGSRDSPSDFKERATRLVGSLNMPDTIKVVVATINGDKVFSGLNFSEPQNSGTIDETELSNVKKSFVQVLEVRHGFI